MYSVPSVKQLRDDTANGKHKFTVVSTFAGGGGSSTGYRMAGGKVLGVNEFVPEAIKTYKSNWPDTLVLPHDVKTLSADQILKSCAVSVGDLDIFDGSPPCSAFSIAGNRDKGWGQTKKYSDTKQENVEDLFFDYIRLLRGIQPKVFVAENVAGLAKGVAKGYLNEILRELKSSGYKVECKMLDARYLGVPQSRTRVIFVGVRDDLWRQSFKGRLHPKPSPNTVSLNEAFQGLFFSEQDKLETDISKFAIYSELVNLKKGGQSTKYFQLIKANPKKFSGCVTATAGNKGAASVKHWDNRAFTVGEVKRIMSVPDDYILTGTYQQKIERLGRMVPPLMIKAVAENICSLGVIGANT